MKKKTLKKAIHWLHLWLGLTAGSIILIVGLTGCLYVFADDIAPLISSYQRAPEKQAAYALPSTLAAEAEKAMPGKTARYINYEKDRSAYIGLYGEKYNLALYADPYTGQQLHITDYDHGFDFFNFVLNGHRTLWLPYNIGSKIVDAPVLIFVFMLISGLVLWWPKNWRKANRDKSLKIKLSATIKRLNYDLHNVLGFYAVLPLIIISFTGLAWGYEWFEKTIYFATSGGQTAPKYVEPLSDSLLTGKFEPASADRLFTAYRQQYPTASIAIFFPEKRADAIQLTVNHIPGKNYARDFLYFDQVSLKPLSGPGVFNGPYKSAPLAARVERMYYDLHTGQIWGWPTKILAFSASLICASLPVTGFCIWWNRRNKKPARTKQRTFAPTT